MVDSSVSYILIFLEPLRSPSEGIILAELSWANGPSVPTHDSLQKLRGNNFIVTNNPSIAVIMINKNGKFKSRHSIDKLTI